VLSVLSNAATFAVGASTMRGTYDPEHRLPFSIYGAHAVLRIKDLFVRAEYLSRRTAMSLGDDPEQRFRYGPNAAGVYDPYVVKDGGYVEVEVPLGSRVAFVAREDALRRRGNVVKMSTLRSESILVRSTVGLAILLRAALRLKLSYELYDFSDFEDEQVAHIGIAGPF
jgi:hypothetical protein